MYCSACGASVAQGLSYCNHCGAKLSAAKAAGRAGEIEPASLIGGIVSAFVLGLLAIAVLMGVMKAVLGLNVGIILTFTALSFLIMLVVEGVLIRLLLGRGQVAGRGALPRRQATKELDAARAGLLPEPLPSVTEEATRTLEPAYRERPR
jgi:hypothetical protein